MKNPLQHIEPKEIWAHFNLINAIPRASKKEQAISNFMVSFGQNLGLETVQNKALNVLIKKPATAGYENRKKVTLQSHLDMVHQKNNDTVFDFDTQGINMFVDGDWVKAKGTTLGADNGLGVAAIMSILADKNMEHPDLEALFTIDEETGMTGAFELQPGFISGDILLNLDTEEDDEITIGCAGGIDITATKTYHLTPIKPDSYFYSITLNGLNGGHSGMDIIKGLGNANKLITRILFELQKNINFQLVSLQGGNLRNAIPREAECVIAVDNQQKFQQNFVDITSKLKTEWQTKEPNLIVNYKNTESSVSGLDVKEQDQLLNTLYACHNGVYTMDANIDGLVATSNNVASVKVENGSIIIACLTRSSIESEKEDLTNKLTATFNLGGFIVQTDGAYPGWQPNPKSSILQTMEEIYQDLFDHKPNVNACHAGLECGIIGEHYPHMEMVSFGPTIRGAHSPDERASITSTQKFWCFLTEILKNIPHK
ncbi:aminoacyl-histidine dipeptidase [Wenyingzhuangia marina]|uniref:Cytosol non-specific dipeptidase n=1 Tax=Wenyingzhuangia marina TaxID=1195760 RepID=A0A1M5VUS5_9FLAO|nr:aminoacyl-histidine dipeptidase [Wenyingzhuangia marina]GGF77687.1 aminoacyl-histidine dipeptidase [Wenyingzhuangia marina]SHH79049.1 dipeptidase D [Wenyingzhuangia marina]